MNNRFGGYGGGNNMQSMMRQAQKMQQDVIKAKEELNNSIFEGNASGGLVRVEIYGNYEMSGIKIEPSIVDVDDIETLEDLIVVAYNDAAKKLEKKKNEKLGAFGGLV